MQGIRMYPHLYLGSFPVVRDFAVSLGLDFDVWVQLCYHHFGRVKETGDFSKLSGSFYLANSSFHFAIVKKEEKKRKKKTQEDSRLAFYNNHNPHRKK